MQAFHFGACITEERQAIGLALLYAFFAYAAYANGFSVG